MKTKNIIITAGDPLGIGPIVLVKALKKFKQNEGKIRGKSQKNAALNFVVIGEKSSLLEAGWHIGLGKLIEVKTKYKKPAKIGPSKYGGDISFKALQMAVEMMLNGEAKALITAPISKEAWKMAGVKFTGHTDYLHEVAAKEGALMMFTSGRVNAALVSEHLAIKDISRNLTKAKIIKTVEIFAKVLKTKKDIAIAALNPHAGDGGKLGDEEIKIIRPSMAALSQKGYKLSGPWPIDALWAKHAAGQFKGIVCMYHDQALLGIKLAAKEPIVHTTAGLKFLRVSPTHGTAFDLVAKNDLATKSKINKTHIEKLLDASSMLAAIETAVK
ncbi:MAG: 4-hydroxythreonine-4-phosphate dehydrogenase PdxA [Elusimicrobiota bacterium]|jgi:4-hydroxythreonine-4-phosphate dehydrogenase|nr:4-hydroxythreonine-4-phosphate dehydrogenase PdxA [Elusimicrobiota bacterium]